MRIGLVRKSSIFSNNDSLSSYTYRLSFQYLIFTLPSLFFYIILVFPPKLCLIQMTVIFQFSTKFLISCQFLHTDVRCTYCYCENKLEGEFVNLTNLSLDTFELCSFRFVDTGTPADCILA